MATGSVGSRGAVVSAAPSSEQMLAGSIPTVGDFYIVSPCKKAVFACLATDVKQNTFTLQVRTMGIARNRPWSRNVASVTFLSAPLHQDQALLMWITFEKAMDRSKLFQNSLSVSQIICRLLFSISLCFFLLKKKVQWSMFAVHVWPLSFPLTEYLRGYRKSSQKPCEENKIPFFFDGGGSTKPHIRSMKLWAEHAQCDNQPKP